jgi:integrase/recombinase XerD
VVDVEAWLAQQFRAKAKATSSARRLSSLRRFYALQLQQATIRSDPTARVRAPKLPRRLPKNLSEDQVETLLGTPDVGTPLGLRDRAMLETLYATGLRVSELTGLKMAQVSLDMGVVRVLAGQQGRLVPLGEEAIAWIKRYLETARTALAAKGRSDAMFVTARGGPMTRQAFWALLALRGESRIPAASPSRTCCGTRSRRICSITARTCASCSCCSARGHHDDDDLHARRAERLKSLHARHHPRG